jgi:putative (di)nucleoside polyphosphate hydrolase
MEPRRRPDYRRGVVAVIRDARGRVLVGKHRHPPDAHFVFPQGGTEPGETPEQAILREVAEELGDGRVQVHARTPGDIQYDFPPEVAQRAGYKGKVHHWFLLSYQVGAGPDLSRGDGELVALDWVTVEEAVQRAIAWRRESYVRGLTALGLLPVTAPPR